MDGSMYGGISVQKVHTMCAGGAHGVSIRLRLGQPFG